MMWLEHKRGWTWHWIEGAPQFGQTIALCGATVPAPYGGPSRVPRHYYCRDCLQVQASLPGPVPR